MTQGKGRRPPLVATRRPVSGGGAATVRTAEGGTGGAAKPAARSLSKAGAKPSRRTRRARSKNPILRILGALWRFIWRLLWVVSSRLAVLGLVVLGLVTGYFYLTLPDAARLTDGRVRGSVTMLDRDGNVFAWRGNQFGGMVTTQTVSPHLLNAVVATEDKRFYRHFGVSPRGIASAVRINMREGRGPLSGNGGSTITQQVAKLLCLGVEYDPRNGLKEAEFEADCRRSSVWRKIKEVPYALAMEMKFSKDEILMVYLNRVYLGAGANGFEAASQRYFGKSAREVKPAEAAMLAGLLVAPSRFAPTGNLARSQERAAVIIGLMEEQGYLSAAAATEARANPAGLSEAAAQAAGGSYADWVMEAGPGFLTRDTSEDVIIRTTFDPAIQKAAEEALAWVFDNRVRDGSKAQAAIVVMSADGAVRAMVGGRGAGAGQFNRATQALRQTGSAFKPFVYAAALDLGYRFDTMVIDEPLTVNIPGSGPWSPQNYTDEFYGPMTLTDALANSINTVAVRVAMDVGLDTVRLVAREFGVPGDLAAGPALALGASETTLLDLTGAYAGILNGGRSVTPYGLEELTLQGDASPLMGKAGGMGERVIGEGAARQLVYMMSEVVNSGSGRRAAPGDRPAAGKTGTTQGARDAWFIGFTADYVAGVWMGNDDNAPLTSVTGGTLPAEIWRETMTRAHAGLPPRPLPMIDPVAEASPSETGNGPRGDPAQTILDEVLNAIFGRRPRN